MTNEELERENAMLDRFLKLQDQVIDLHKSVRWCVERIAELEASQEKGNKNGDGNDKAV